MTFILLDPPQSHLPLYYFGFVVRVNPMTDAAFPNRWSFVNFLLRNWTPGWSRGTTRVLPPLCCWERSVTWTSDVGLGLGEVCNSSDRRLLLGWSIHRRSWSVRREVSASRTLDPRWRRLDRARPCSHIFAYRPFKESPLTTSNSPITDPVWT